MANLAIKGHATRGKEIIEILEMLGGKNPIKWNGSNQGLFHFVDVKGNINTINDTSKHLCKYNLYTLEGFLEEFPYKVGDKVLYKIYGIYSKIKSMLWNNEKEQVFYRLESNKLFVATADELKPYKEDAMEENIKEKCDLINFNSHYIFDFSDKVELILKDDWEVKNEDGRTYVVRKQPQYPKTYNECWKILDAGEEEVLLDGATASEEFLFDSFIKLKRCRDAYWKIAGNWKPDFANYEEKFIITNYYGKVYTPVGTNYNRILIFPTEEMRDAFYENFKDLIEQCKELL